MLRHGIATTPCPKCGEPMGMVSWVGEKPLCHRCQTTRRVNTFLSDMDAGRDAITRDDDRDWFERLVDATEGGG